jgi:FkbH-like protein
MSTPELSWLPQDAEWSTRAKTLDADPACDWDALVGLANARLDFLRTERLDRMLQRRFGEAAPKAATGKPIRLAILGSSTVTHLQAGLRVAALRRGLWLTSYETEYGQYFQELLDRESGLHAFRPNAVLFALDAHHLTQGADAGLSVAEAEALIEEKLQKITECWRLARAAFGATILQQAVLPVPPVMLGSNEHRLPGSPDRLVGVLNTRLRAAADAFGAQIVALDERAAQDGVRSWHDPVLWHRAKQEVTPAATPLYGDLVVRILAAQQGRSFKCLVLDLDNTLWGGVIGDDGLEGIVLGQGSAQGEAFIAFQNYARQLTRRGIILAVCSKNDEANAWSPFDQHPEMLLKRQDIASFVANWTDKPSNIRAIAAELNIGLDSLVFVDDNPFERNLVRRELPMVAVPEVGDDPAFYAQFVADAGYFEALSVTAEDRERSAQYQANRERESLKATATDLPSYLRSLEMAMQWRRFDKIGLNRIVQLINKTNQFNLMTRRYTEDDVLAVMNDPKAFGLQLRLLDRFGDNGIIAIVIGKMNGEPEVEIDTWLMSCRVLGRQVEEATLNLIAAEAQRLGAEKLVGEYRPTAKNGMVKDHYRKLGFNDIKPTPEGGSRATLDLRQFSPYETFMQIVEVTQ